MIMSHSRALILIIPYHHSDTAPHPDPLIKRLHVRIAGKVHAIEAFKELKHVLHQSLADTATTMAREDFKQWDRCREEPIADRVDESNLAAPGRIDCEYD